MNPDAVSGISNCSATSCEVQNVKSDGKFRFSLKPFHQISGFYDSCS